jgi:chaperonin GroEL
MVNHPGMQTGEQIFNEALKAPTRTIARNAGKNPDTVVEKVLDSDNPNFGWDAKTDQYVDMIKSGIIDPTKVVRKAIENATSMASMFLTTESVIVEIPEPKPEDKRRPR